MEKKSRSSGKKGKADLKKKVDGEAVQKSRNKAKSDNRADKNKAKGSGKLKRKPAITKERRKGQTKSKNRSFPIVGVGASAGGLEAFTQLLTALPGDTGMAFVLVQHLDPKHESKLTELLFKATKMPIAEVKDGVAVESDHVYIIPPNTSMAISRGILKLTPRADVRGLHMPVDYFFHSLAQDQGSKAVGVILSGNASDGTLGLKAIKAEGGITFAQDTKSAKYDSMPNNAIVSGAVDFIMRPDAIALELSRIGSHPYVAPSVMAKDTPVPPKVEHDFRSILALIRSASGVDFTHYKDTTLKRRIKRRMVLHKIEKVADYVNYLQQDYGEVQALYQDMLISVTGFFRDPETFEVLKSKVFPQIVKDRAPEEPIRIWVPGCSTGEECYSLAMSLLEFLGKRASNIPIQIFATDLSETVIEKARAGVYLESAMHDVSPDRLSRFFVKVEHGYKISKAIREMCVFARQNVVKDPPFSKLDLISCRNVLIYLGLILQKKVLPIFHYSLKSTGFLVLGTSETVGSFTDMFRVVDRKQRIYSKKTTPASIKFDFNAKDYSMEKIEVDRDVNEEPRRGLDVQQEADRIVLTRYAPAGVVIDDSMEVLQFRGHTGFYLEPAPGRASLNLLRMVREGLFLDLRAAIHKARKQDIPVKKERLQVTSNRDFREVNLEVIPIKSLLTKERFFLVLFEDVTPAPEVKETREKSMKGAKTGQKGENPQVARFKRELSTTRAYLHAIIEEQEATNEELRSANEEILSSNEELQSTNEELETAKEELQSTNEELTTVNEELQNRNIELSQVTNDLINLFSSVNIPIVMLDSNLRLRRFTPMAEKLLNLIPTDIGRPISDIKPNINVPDLEELVLDVIERIGIKEREVQDREGHWHSMRIRPYRTAENQIDGAVITFVDVDQLRKSIEQIKESRDYIEAIVETVKESLLVLDESLHVNTANKSFYETFRVLKEETENQLIYELGNGQWNIPKLRELLEVILPQNTQFERFEVEHEFPQIGRKTMLLSARQIYNRNRNEKLILLAIEDITDRKRIEAELLESQKLESIGVLAAGIAHDLNNILSSVLGNISLVTNFSTLDDKARRRLAEAERAGHRIQALTQQLLTFSKGGAPVKRITSIRALLKDSASIALVGSSIKCEYFIPEDLWPVDVDEEQLTQTINNLAINAKEAMPDGGVMRIAAENLRVTEASESPHIEEGKYVKITVEDKGAGIPDEHIGRIFDPFFTTKQGASGLGLTTAYSIIKKHDGHIAVESEIGVGARFYVYIPTADGKSVEEKESKEKLVVGKGRILVMDDEEGVRKLLAEVLRSLGYSAEFARDGGEAIELYSRARESGQPFDAVLLDLTVIGGMGGKEAMGKLREIDPGVKALVSSGYSDDAVMAAYEKYGFRGVISKPYRIEKLSTLLHELINEDQ